MFGIAGPRRGLRDEGTTARAVWPSGVRSQPHDHSAEDIAKLGVADDEIHEDPKGNIVVQSRPGRTGRRGAMTATDEQYRGAKEDVAGFDEEVVLLPLHDAELDSIDVLGGRFHGALGPVL